MHRALRDGENMGRGIWLWVAVGFCLLFGGKGKGRMKLLIITETNTPGVLAPAHGDQKLDFQVHSLAPGRKLDQPHSALPAMIHDAGATHVALCSRLVESEQRSALFDHLTSAAQTPLWLPLVPASPADFLVRSVGMSLASLWFPAWQAGTVLVPASRLLENATASFQPLNWLIRAGYGPDTEAPGPHIDWSDNLLPLPTLVPWKGRCTDTQRALIHQAETWLPVEYDRNVPDFRAIQAGLLLWLDELKLSHEFAQSIEFTGTHRAGDYWHAIMHRREPDYGNSKYWFRHVGKHPIFAELAPLAREMAREMNLTLGNMAAEGSPWDPFAFVDWCSRCEVGSPEDLFARRLQAVEMILLLRQTLQDARRDAERN